MAWDYNQTNDPGAVGAGKTWYHTTSGDLKIRNSGNTAWNLLLNSDLVNGGNVPVTGAAMSGPLTGLTGVAASDAHDFATSVRKSGVELATMNDLSNMQTSLYTNMSDKISELIASFTKSGSMGDSIKAVYGELVVGSGHADNLQLNIAKPAYNTGSVAADNECTSIVGVIDETIDATANSIQIQISKVNETTYKIRTLKNGVHEPTIACRLAYFIVAVKR